MKRNLSNNEKYWQMKERNQLREEYAVFLREKGVEMSPHTAQLFAMYKLSGAHKYLGLNERQIIIELAGKLPYMYD